MRVWDVDPGYLSRQRLLGEHREIHGLYVVLAENRSGYRHHPETLRWVGALPALARRHAHLRAEMHLRGYNHQSPMPGATHDAIWPTTFIDPPHEQWPILRQKYVEGESGRIPLPRNAQQLWAQHKYSVMARSPALYQTLGPTLAKTGRAGPDAELCKQLVDTLRSPAPWPRTRNALAHMWGIVSQHVSPEEVATMHAALTTAPRRVLARTAALAKAHQVTYLLHSTALAELMVYLPSEASRPLA
jgi:hypothetical protein